MALRHVPCGAPAWDVRYDTTPARLAASGTSEPESGLSADRWAAGQGAYMGLLVAAPFTVDCERTEAGPPHWSQR